MQRKSGLLPKWLFLNTVIRSICLFLEDSNAFGILGLNRKIYVYFTFLWACARLFGITKINSAFYIFLMVSYVLEILWFTVAGYYKCFSAIRVVFEVVLSIFSLAWLVFLYPYYLLDGKERENEEGEEKED